MFILVGLSHMHVIGFVCVILPTIMTRFKDKILKNLMCTTTLATKIQKFNIHMSTIEKINVVTQQWLGAIPFEKWAFSHNGGRRYDIMTTNMSKVFNSVPKKARSLPITTLVQLTFFQLNSYFIVRREQCANQLASNEEYTPYVDVNNKANLVKVGFHELFLYDHIQGRFHVKTSSGTKSSSTSCWTYRVNLHEHAYTCGKTPIYGFPCNHILAACHFRLVDFRPLVQHYYST